MGTAVSQSQTRVGGIFVSSEDIVVTGSDGKDKRFPAHQARFGEPIYSSKPSCGDIRIIYVVVPSYVFSALNPRGRG